MTKTLPILAVMLFLVWPLPVKAGAVIENAFSPAQGATDLIVKTIGEAQNSVRVAAYFFTSYPIAKALVAAEQRGVDVKVVLDHHQKFRNILGYLNRNGVATRLNSRYAIMHDKFIIVDGRTLETGSFNFTRAAEYENAENVIVLRDSPKTVANYARQWDKLWAEAAPRDY